MNIELAARLQSLQLTQVNLKLISFLITNEQAYQEFMYTFWQGIEKQFIAIASLRVMMIERNNMSFEEFCRMCSIDLKNGLESLFLQKVEYSIVSLIEDKIKSGKLTLEFMFNELKRSKGLNIIKLVKEMRN